MLYFIYGSFVRSQFYSCLYLLCVPFGVIYFRKNAMLATKSRLVEDNHEYDLRSSSG